MPNTPAQFPNYDLPGAEWFSLASNANIAIQGRRRKQLSSGVSGVLPDATGSNSLQTVLETNFTPTSGVFIHNFWIYANMVGGESLSIVSGAAGLTLSATGSPADYSLGFASPPKVIFTDRDRLVTARDIFGFQSPVSSTLSVIAFVTMYNPSAAQINYTLNGGIIYTRLEGFTE